MSAQEEYANGKDPTSPAEVEFIGPFEEHRVIIDGRQVPHLTADPEPGGKVCVSIDHRLAIVLTLQEADRFLPWVADLIAVCHGWNCFPRGYMGDDLPTRQEDTLFPKVFGISSVVTEPMEPPDDDPFKRL